ncbi:MAG TPA: hypothetical protein VNW97_00635 [Candidatus Saccharimonadales bacterium]|nr:hypothetical protein [Candidatus Saccharimonadales bacterium]
MKHNGYPVSAKGTWPRINANARELGKKPKMLSMRNATINEWKNVCLAGLALRQLAGEPQ